MDNFAMQLVTQWIKNYPMLIHCTRVSDRWHYEQGCLLKGIHDVYRYTGENYLMEYIRTNMDRYVDNDGNIRTYREQDYNLDQINNGKMLLQLYRYTGKEKYALAAKKLIVQMDNQPRTKSGGFWHKKIYPHQMWLDGHYMAMPFLAEYGTMFGERCYIDEAVQQLILMEDKARDSQTGLLYHGWDESRGQRWSNPVTGQSPQVWGRGMGWFAMALVDILPFLDKHEGREEVAAMLQRCSEAVLNVQDTQTGLWYQVMDQGTRQGNYLEASASSMFTYTLKKGNVLGILGPEMAEAAKRAYQGMITKFLYKDRKGMLSVKQNCKVAGLGGQPYRDGSYTYYVSEPIVEDDLKSLGACIMALSAVEYL